MGNVVDLKMMGAGDEQPNPDATKITFETFWRAWPRTRRLCKKQAAYQWSLINPIHHAQILKAVLTFRETEGWKKDNGAYIPYAFRWLRDERWTDEVETDLTMGQCSWNRNGNRGPEPKCSLPAS